MTLVDMDTLTASDLYELAGARRMREIREAGQATGQIDEDFDWQGLRAWLPDDHPDKYIGCPDKPALGAYWPAKETFGPEGLSLPTGSTDPEEWTPEQWKAFDRPEDFRTSHSDDPDEAVA